MNQAEREREMVKINCSTGELWNGFSSIATGFDDQKCCSSAHCFDHAPQELASDLSGHLATILSRWWGFIEVNFFQRHQLRFGSNFLGR